MVTSTGPAGDSPSRLPDAPLEIGGDVQEPFTVYAPRPEYLPEARQARIEDAVIVRATIDRDGQLADLKVLEGLPLGLTEQALEAISRWHFRPATLDGAAVDVTYDLTVEFRLR